MDGGSWLESARGRRSALIVASEEYQDAGLSELRAPAADADALAAVLSDPEIGGFEVRKLLNEPAHVVNEAVEEFFTDRSPDDLLLLHFSCHGIKDQGGDLYFAMANTRLRVLAATAVAADFVNRRMTQSRSRRIVLFLDCCYAGAFDRGMTTRASKVMDLEERFGGRGRAVITASGAVEYAFESGELTESSDPAPSVFTTAMVRGLTTGEADRDHDGYVDLDELYDYVYDAVREVTPYQTPGKWTFGVQGDLVIARRNTPVTGPASAVLGGSTPTGPAGATGPAPPIGPTGPAGASAPTRHPPRATTPPNHARPHSTPPSRPRTRWWPSTTRGRALLAALAAAVLIVGGVVTWRVLDQAAHSTTIPASFDGQWKGTDSVGAGFTATLRKDLQLGQLNSANSMCYVGSLSVSDATDSQLTTRLAPEGPGCSQWTVVFTHLSGGELRMAVDPDGSAASQPPFEVRMTKQG